MIIYPEERVTEELCSEPHAGVALADGNLILDGIKDSIVLADRDDRILEADELLIVTKAHALGFAVFGPGFFVSPAELEDSYSSHRIDDDRFIGRLMKRDRVFVYGVISIRPFSMPVAVEPLDVRGRTFLESVRLVMPTTETAPPKLFSKLGLTASGLRR